MSSFDLYFRSLWAITFLRIQSPAKGNALQVRRKVQARTHTHTEACKILDASALACDQIAVILDTSLRHGQCSPGRQERMCTLAYIQVRANFRMLTHSRLIRPQKLTWPHCVMPTVSSGEKRSSRMTVACPRAGAYPVEFAHATSRCDAVGQPRDKEMLFRQEDPTQRYATGKAYIPLHFCKHTIKPESFRTRQMPSVVPSGKNRILRKSTGVSSHIDEFAFVQSPE